MSRVIRLVQGAATAATAPPARRVLTESGPVRLDIPRDRNGTFEPQIAPKGARRLDGIDKIVLGLYAKGLAVRDTQAHLIEIYDVEVSADLISKITDAGRRDIVPPTIRRRRRRCRCCSGGSV